MNTWLHRQHTIKNLFINKNAFQWDAYRPPRLLTVSQHALWLGGVPAQGGVPTLGVYLPRGCTCLGGVPAQVLHPCGQTDTCKNITFANFVCGR